MRGHHGRWLKDEGSVTRFEHHGLVEGHVVADARLSTICQVRVGHPGGCTLAWSGFVDRVF